MEKLAISNVSEKSETIIGVKRKLNELEKNTKELEQQQQEKKQKIVAYTDGSCSGNGTPNAIAGCGVWFGVNHPKNVSEKVVCDKATSQVAELYAAKRALEVLSDRSDTPVEIISDSSYLINTMTVWLNKRIKVNWEVINGPLLKEIYDLMTKRNGKVTWTYVKGHNGIVGNKNADKLARDAIGLKGK